MVVPWFLSRPQDSNDYSVFGSSLVFSPRQIGIVLGKGILRKVLFALSAGVVLCDVVSPKGEVVAAELR